MKKAARPPSQAVDLFVTLADALGLRSDRELAGLADCVVDNVVNWRTGTVREFKAHTLDAIKASLVNRIQALYEEAERARDASRSGLHPLIVEEGSGPDDLHRQFRERVAFDYLGHRFLYYEPQGALAWLNMIQTGYEQDAWVAGTANAAREWLSRTKDASGRAKGPIALAANLDRKGNTKAIEVIGLGSGDGAKEVAVLREVIKGAADSDGITFVPIDVSIPLLLRAAASGRMAFGEVDAGNDTMQNAVLPLCADFEEGPLTFVGRLPSAARAPDRAVRLIMLLGNIFGNLRDEDRFVRQKLWTIARPGDLVWIEVALRMDPLSDDPLFRMTEARQGDETAAENNRRLLLEGPFRRWEAAMGRRRASVELKVFVRQDDDSSRVPGSCNFCHDLVIAKERRSCTMLFSRRYAVDGLVGWLEERGFTVERVVTVRDSRRRQRVAHLLLRRR